jgi:hypothetical protein
VWLPLMSVTVPYLVYPLDEAMKGSRDFFGVPSLYVTGISAETAGLPVIKICIPFFQINCFHWQWPGPRLNCVVNSFKVVHSQL